MYYHFVLQDYETDLVSYSSGLETLLNIPIKRTMLKSPSMDLNLEVIKPDWNSCLIETLELLKMFSRLFSYEFAKFSYLNVSVACLCLRPHNYKPVTWSCSLILMTTTNSWESCSKTWRSSRYYCCVL